MRRALLICNSVFPNDPARLPPLLGPRSDGMHLWAALSDAGAGLFRAEDVLVLHERSAGEILGATEEFFVSAQPGDTLLFYYSGHGQQVSRELYLCGRETVADRLASSALPGDLLRKLMDRSHAGTIVVVLDCCYSGAFAKGGAPVDPQQLAGAGRYVITASSSVETAADTERNGLPSPFTAALVESLRDAAEDSDRDGYVDLDDLFRQLKRSLPAGLPEPRRKFDGSGTVPIARRRPPQPKGGDTDARPPAELRSDAAHGDEPPTPEVLSLAAWFQGLHLRRRGDLGYGDLNRWIVDALAALALVLLSTLGRPAFQDEADAVRYGDFGSGDVDFICNLCLAIGAVVLAVLLAEWHGIRRLRRRSRSRAEVMALLRRGGLGWAARGRDALGVVIGLLIVLRMTGGSSEILLYAVAFALLAVFPVITLAGSFRRGDAVYLAGSALSFAGLLVPRQELGYGATNEFGVLVMAHLVLALVMFGGWALRRRPRTLVLFAVLPVLLFMVAVLQTDLLPLVALLGSVVALLGCLVGAGQPLPMSGRPETLPELWTRRLREAAAERPQR